MVIEFPAVQPPPLPPDLEDKYIVASPERRRREKIIIGAWQSLSLLWTKSIFIGYGTYLERVHLVRYMSISHNLLQICNGQDMHCNATQTQRLRSLGGFATRTNMYVRALSCPVLTCPALPWSLSTPDRHPPPPCLVYPPLPPFLLVGTSCTSGGEVGARIVICRLASEQLLSNMYVQVQVILRAGHGVII